MLQSTRYPMLGESHRVSALELGTCKPGMPRYRHSAKRANTLKDLNTRSLSDILRSRSSLAEALGHRADRVVDTEMGGCEKSKVALAICTTLRARRREIRRLPVSSGSCPG